MNIKTGDILVLTADQDGLLAGTTVRATMDVDSSCGYTSNSMVTTEIVTAASGSHVFSGGWSVELGRLMHHQPISASSDPSYGTTKDPFDWLAGSLFTIVDMGDHDGSMVKIYTDELQIHKRSSDYILTVEVIVDGTGMCNTGMAMNMSACLRNLSPVEPHNVNPFLPLGSKEKSTTIVNNVVYADKPTEPKKAEPKTAKRMPSTDETDIDLIMLD